MKKSYTKTGLYNRIKIIAAIALLVVCILDVHYDTVYTTWLVAKWDNHGFCSDYFVRPILPLATVDLWMEGFASEAFKTSLVTMARRMRTSTRGRLYLSVWTC